MRTLSLLFFLASARIAAAAPTPQTFDLPDHGTLTLAVPEGWTAALKQPANHLPPTILLTPTNGTRFDVLVTAIWPIGSAGRTDEPTLRAEVTAAAKGAEGQAVEPSLAIQEFTGSAGHGYFFSATDKAPKAGEYKYLLQGTMRTGDVALAYTVLTNDGQGAVPRAALEMLKTATHKR